MRSAVCRSILLIERSASGTRVISYLGMSPIETKLRPRLLSGNRLSASLDLGERFACYLRVERVFDYLAVIFDHFVEHALQRGGQRGRDDRSKPLAAACDVDDLTALGILGGSLEVVGAGVVFER